MPVCMLGVSPDFRRATDLNVGSIRIRFGAHCRSPSAWFSERVLCKAGGLPYKEVGTVTWAQYSSVAEAWDAVKSKVGDWT